MVDVISKKCKKCKQNQPRPKFQGLCGHCYALENPSVKIHLPKTEDRVIEFIQQEFPDIDFQFNKSIPGCKRSFRPDILCENDYLAIIIEVDEYQHKMTRPEYDKDYTKNRDEEIHKAVGKPLIIIRFNTHAYRKNGVMQYSPIHLITHEIVNHNEWNARLEALKKYFDSAISMANIPKYCHVERMFYDE